MMNTHLTSILFCAALLGATGCERPAKGGFPKANGHRIVTLSPSLSETLYALGLGDRIVGVTAFARYPEAVQHMPKVGGYSDINIEAVYALKPDLVLALEQQEEILRQLRALKIHTVAFKNESIGDILNLIQHVGDRFDCNEKADELCAAIVTQQRRLEAAAQSKPRRRILISVGRNMGTGKMGDVYAAGPSTLFGEIIALAGGENVYQGNLPYAALGKEALLRLNPEIIIDLIPDMDLMPEFTAAIARDQWNEFEGVDAVRHNKITIRGADYICIPGPRITSMMRDIAHAIHPDLDWSHP